jgi:hypothetical protein
MDLDQGNEAAQRNGQEEPRKNRYIYIEKVYKSC